MPQRPYKSIPGRRLILIQCEGKRTEYIYLDSFCAACRRRGSLFPEVNPGKGQSAVVTVETALAKIRTESTRGKRYDEVYCVLDVEHAAHAETLAQAVALADKHGIVLALSNPSFEVWLLCHFERPMKWFEKSKAAEDYLTAAHWKTHFGCPYEKSDPKLYERLKDRLGDAVANARYILEEHDGLRACRSVNPSTEVYKLVERLSALE